MRIVEHTDTRLVLAGRRTLFAVGMVFFVFFSGVMLLNLLVQFNNRALEFTTMQRLGFVIWTGVALFLMAVGVWILNRNARGIRCIFDREHRVVTLRRPYRLTTKDEAWSIFAVTGLEVTHDERLKMFALWLCLRNGERISLGSASPFEEAHLQQLSKTVREFLGRVY